MPQSASAGHAGGPRAPPGRALVSPRSRGGRLEWQAAALRAELSARWDTLHRAQSRAAAELRACEDARRAAPGPLPPAAPGPSIWDLAAAEVWEEPGGGGDAQGAAAAHSPVLGCPAAAQGLLERLAAEYSAKDGDLADELSCSAGTEVLVARAARRAAEQHGAPTDMSPVEVLALHLHREPDGTRVAAALQAAGAGEWRKLRRWCKLASALLAVCSTAPVGGAEWPELFSTIDEERAAELRSGREVCWLPPLLCGTRPPTGRRAVVLRISGARCGRSVGPDAVLLPPLMSFRVAARELGGAQPSVQLLCIGPPVAAGFAAQCRRDAQAVAKRLDRLLREEDELALTRGRSAAAAGAPLAAAAPWGPAPVAGPAAAAGAAGAAGLAPSSSGSLQPTPSPALQPAPAVAPQSRRWSPPTAVDPSVHHPQPQRTGSGMAAQWQRQAGQLDRHIVDVSLALERRHYAEARRNEHLRPDPPPPAAPPAEGGSAASAASAASAGEGSAPAGEMLLTPAPGTPSNGAPPAAAAVDAE